MTTTHKYHDVEFEIDENFRFSVPALGKSFPSYAEMQTAVDNAAKVLELSKREKLALKCVNDKGKPVTVTGVHAGHGTLTTVPKNEDEAYADVGWVREALSVKRQLEDKLAKSRDILERVRLRPKERNGYGSFSPEMHPVAIARIKAQYAEAERITSESTFEECVAKSKAHAPQFD